MVNSLVDLVKIYATNTGTGSFALGSAVPSFRGADALTDGATYGYSVQQGANYEVGSGVYSLSTNTLTRGVQWSSAGGSPINLQPNAVINFPALAADFAVPGPIGPQGPPGPPGGDADLSALLVKAANLSDLTDPAAARANLGLGDAALADAADFLATANNLSDVPDDAAARANLGIAYIFSVWFGATPTSNEILLIHPVGRATTLPADLAGALKPYVGTNPAAAFSFTLATVAGGVFATISISTAGVVTATTAGGVAVNLAATDIIIATAPASADTAIANCGFTILGS